MAAPLGTVRTHSYDPVRKTGEFDECCFLDQACSASTCRCCLISAQRGSVVEADPSRRLCTHPWRCGALGSFLLCEEALIEVVYTE